MPSLKTVVIGESGFYYCDRVVFESESERMNVMDRLARIDFYSTL